MILADKIIRLRKQYGWSQEELAEKLGVSRQSVSKWESANSIPDLNKILMLGEIFGVSTDYLVKDEIEEVESLIEDKEIGVVKVTLEEAMKFVDNKVKMAKQVSIGLLFVFGSVIPLLLMLALSELDGVGFETNTATALGLLMLFILLSIGISFFIRASQYENEPSKLKEEGFELVYGVKSVIKERAQQYKNVYHIRISIGIMMVITCVAPLILVSLLVGNYFLIMMMVILMLVMVGFGVVIIITASTKYNAYNLIIGEGEYAPDKRVETKRAEKLGAFYWPLVTAIYIGWSLITMNWGFTWIVWPVAGVAFASLLGLMRLFEKEA